MRVTIAIAGLLLGFAALISLPVGQNLWFQLTSRGWFIPSESNLWRFRPLVFNQGSGEWWLIAEDPHWYFYAGDGVGNRPYLKRSRQAAEQCPGFVPLDVATWCLSVKGD